MNEVKIYVYNQHEVIAVFDSTNGEIVAPLTSQQKIATEEDALLFFEQQGILVPDYFKSILQHDSDQAEELQQES